MAEAFRHNPVPFFVGTIISDESLWEPVSKALSIWGEFDFFSEKCSFDNFTHYYEPEMGKELIRFWAAFKEMRMPEELVRMKWSCTAIENTFSIESKRRVNLDPGYLTEAKIVLASFKDFSHRLYLTQGVFADMQLMFRSKNFVPMEWTFSDYKSETAQAFFLRLRERYREWLKAQAQSESDSAIGIGQETD